MFPLPGNDTLVPITKYKSVRGHMTGITIGLLNNMPDSAFEATESQFRGLLEAATAQPVHLRLTSLPEIPRSAAIQAYMTNRYATLSQVLREAPDAIIVTGTEPLAADLRDEPYWPRFTEVVDWSVRHSVPSIWSCLAAHAAVLHLTGIERARLRQKCCGVFAHTVHTDHALMHGISQPLLTPHSRLNDLPLPALERAGYALISAREESGANVFIGQENAAPMLFLQGHPEYDRDSLLKEYRRDIGRFVRGQHSTYPTPPQGYFAAGTTAALDEFRLRAEAHRMPQIMSAFPAAAIQASLSHSWRVGSVQLYRNWLDMVAAHKTRH
jgi:homoserine O-succinyltransferase/O-acetyltransferase